MSGTATAEALVALHAAEAELEAALAAEKGTDGAPAAEVSIAADEPVSAPVAVAEAPPLSDKFHIPDTPFSRGDDVPPSPIDFEPLKPKYLDMGPGYLGPTAINGT